MALRVDQQHVVPAVGNMAPAEEHIMLAVYLLVAATAGIVGGAGGLLCVAVVQLLELGVGAGTAGGESGGKLLHGRDHGRGVAHADDVVAHPFEVIVNIFAARFDDRCQCTFGGLLQGVAGDQGDDRQQQRNGSNCRQNRLEEQFRAQFHVDVPIASAMSCLAASKSKPSAFASAACSSACQSRSGSSARQAAMAAALPPSAASSSGSRAAIAGGIGPSGRAAAAVVAGLAEPSTACRLARIRSIDCTSCWRIALPDLLSISWSGSPARRNCSSAAARSWSSVMPSVPVRPLKACTTCLAAA
ncbi:MAG: hypothetical protein CAPSK01_003255 [Candidatus Accumulibacter vicinus]|uniref:Uncharacterized protein n=1 Tax=Candidatus Accumulibacter vicinus TaxID=2954382 RepID=A0A084XXZ3_9PROT|nr:MAG: hypothetical protein CAPSK01_003255 [Candidatus Accumulibacter vicinus]